MTIVNENIIVSIIIPCYNVQDYIEECVLSCIEQSFKKIEIICVDNNSTDKTFEILQNLEVKHGITITRELKKGACAARNTGLDLAKGKWINFLDADDLLLPKKIEHQLSIIQDNTDVIVSDYHNLFLDGKKKKRVANQDPIMALLTSNFGCTCSNLWSKEAVVRAGKWNPKMSSSQDYELLFRLIKNKAVFQFDEKSYTVIRSRESGQISQSAPLQKWMNFTILRCQVLEYLRTTNFSGYEDQEDKITLLVFNHVRYLGQLDIEKATYLYKKYFSHSKSIRKGFSPYKLMLKTFGFKNSEKIKTVFKK